MPRLINLDKVIAILVDEFELRGPELIPCHCHDFGQWENHKCCVCEHNRLLGRLLETMETAETKCQRCLFAVMRPRLCAEADCRYLP